MVKTEPPDDDKVIAPYRRTKLLHTIKQLQVLATQSPEAMLERYLRIDSTHIKWQFKYCKCCLASSVAAFEKWSLYPTVS